MEKYGLKDIVAIIVAYNSSCQDSISYRRLNEKGIDIVVCDNSTSDYGNKEIVENDHNIYVSMGGNKGLSKAYNAALDRIGSQYKFICLFDDDTDMGDDYFNKVLEYINSSSAEIFLPVVKTKTRILSPCQFKKKRAVEVKDLDHIDKDNISAINSGMIINAHVFDNYRYNENIFLDYIDHDFMREMNKQHRKVQIMMDNVLNQDFSMETNSLESSYKRLCILNHDLKEYYKEDYLMYVYQITAYKLVMINQHKSLKFLHLKKFEI